MNYLKNKLKNNDCIVLGLSGGPDSMCLLNILLTFKKQKNLKIICAHINHNVRIESEEEASFVKKYVENHGCIFEYYKINDYKKNNFEQFARKKRYQFYEETIKKYQANYLMTAHHGDDLIETILMRLTRGSILKGYAGFNKETKYENYELIRPLIYTTKSEIEKYNKDNNIEYRLDKTNELDDYTRNRYRHHLLPFLKKENKNVHLKFLKFSEELNLIEEFLEKQTLIALTSVYHSDKVNLQEFNKLDFLLKKRVIEYILKKEYQDNISCINEKHIKSILKLCTSTKANQKISLPKKRTLIKSYNELYFFKEDKYNNDEIILEDKVTLSDNSYLIKINDSSIIKSNYILRLNSKEVSLPLKVRYRLNSDRMAVKNLNGTKKIKDILIDEKIPMSKRDKYPIVIDSNNEILWLPGLKKSKFDKNIDEFYDIIYKYVISEETKENE
jgi:tRNA(Ile)-lysidine synthase